MRIVASSLLDEALSWSIRDAVLVRSERNRSRSCESSEKKAISDPDINAEQNNRTTSNKTERDTVIE
jgi:hypothetical protein